MTVTQLAMNGDFNKQTAVEADAAAMKHPKFTANLFLPPHFVMTPASTLTAKVKLSATQRKVR